MDPLLKMLIALISIMTMFLANVFILWARKKLKGALKWLVSIVAYLLLFISLLFILLVVLSF